MNNIYLIGFMAVGKTTVSRELGRRTGRTVIDTDQWIEQQEGRKIARIFAEKGEDYFRDLEKNTLQKIAGEDGRIVSCGGGIIKSEENIRVMKKSGKVILLTAAPETIYSRVGEDKNRPLLEGHRSPEGIRQMMEQRQPLYDRAADGRVSTDDWDLDRICREILNFL